MRILAVPIVLASVVSSAAAAAWPGPPHSPAPRLHQQGPPAAWVETRTRTVWMAFSSYCWSSPAGDRSRKAVCADMIPPQSRTDLPALVVRRNALVRIHLAFIPRTAHLTVFRGMTFKHYVLSAWRVLTWRAARSGIVSVDVRAAPGEAAYLFHISVR